MIRKLIVDPIIPKGSFTLIGEYKDKKSRKHLFLVDEGKRVVTNYEVDDHRVHSISLTDGQPVVIEYDDDVPHELAIVSFLKNHPFCITEGYSNPNYVKDIFRIRLQHEKTELDVAAMESNLEIAIKVLSMTFEQKYDLAFALGINPSGMTHSELIVMLVGANLTGSAISDTETFNHFYNAIDSNKKAYIYANKAIALGIVPFMDGYYKVGGRTIGATHRDVVDLCMSDREFFNGFIVPEVNKLDEKPGSDYDDFSVSGLIKQTIEERSEESTPGSTTQKRTRISKPTV